MSTFDWTLAGPFLIIAALVAALITPSIVRDVREARRARTRGEHAAAIRNRQPYDQERSAS